MRFYLLGGVLWVILTVFATVYCVSTPAKDVKVLSKIAWVAIILLVPVIGAVMFFTIGLGRGDGERKSRTLAPDDDPDFLRKLKKRIEGEKDE